MEGIYPIMIGGKEAGTLEIRQEDIRTAFHAVCDDPGRIVRLAVCGETVYYLGVMLPDQNGHIHLDKVRSKMEMKGFPMNVRYAAPEEECVPDGEALSAEDAPEEHAQNVETEMNNDERCDAVPDAPSDAEAECKEKDATQDDTDTIFWRKAAGGALAGSCGEMRFLAVPLKSGVAPVGDNFVRRMIENTEYAVFEIQKGKIIK